MKAAAAIFLNEIKIELRSLQGLVASGMISLVLLFALRFTLSSEDIDQAQLAPGILWSAVIFSGMGLLSNTSIKANERGTIDFMRMIPVPKSTIFFGKVLGNSFLLLIEVLLIFILYSLLFTNPFGTDWDKALLALILGSLGMSIVTTIVSQLASKIPGAWMATILITIPILLFTVIEASVRAMATLSDSTLDDYNNVIIFILLYNLSFLAAGIWISEFSD